MRTSAVALLVLLSTSAAARPRLIHYTVFVGPRRGGSATLLVRDGGSTRQLDFQYRDRSLGPHLTERLTTDAAGLPIHVHTTGTDHNHNPVDETFARGARTGFYVSENGTPEELAALTRALLIAGGKLALLPSGEATLRAGKPLQVRSAKARRTVTLYAIDGLDLAPTLVWLDDERELFAAGRTIRAGWEAAVAQLEAAETQELHRRGAEHAATLAVRPTHPLALEHAALFDPTDRTLHPRTTVLVDGERVRAVGPDGHVALPADAERLDASGKTILPGLWDLHAHAGPDDGLLLLAAGVTSVRLIAGNAATARAFADGSVLGPRALVGCVVDGPGANASPTPLLVEDEAAARAAVARCAADGAVQVKMYNSFKRALVPALVDEGHRRGLRVSGHVPDGMKAADLVAAGVDELQHAYFVLLQFAHETEMTPIARFTAFAEQAGTVDFAAPPVQAFIAELKRRRVAVDLTLVSGEQHLTARRGEPSPVYAAIAARLPALTARSLERGGLAASGHEAQYRAAFAATLALAAALWRAGVPLAVGTDEQLYGFSLHRELELYVRAGIPPADALWAATLGAAQLMKRDRDLGSIAPGKLADLVVIDGDPLRDISSVRRPTLVLCAGRRLDPAVLLSAIGIRP